MIPVASARLSLGLVELLSLEHPAIRPPATREVIPKQFLVSMISSFMGVVFVFIKNT
jgi:hypothetical protein